MSAVLASGSGVLLLAVAAAVAGWRGLRRLRPVRAWRWLAAATPWGRLWRLRRLRHQKPRSEGITLGAPEQHAFVVLMDSLDDRQALAVAARAEAEHRARLEASEGAE